jgi:LppP/LprE lipoprotein
MNSMIVRITSLMLAILAFHPEVGRSQTNSASWLDQVKPASWNSLGMAIPAAPQTQGPIDARCRTQARPAELEEDKQLRERGWDLFNAFQGGWQIRLIYATASYDGMCRPRQYQVFVFVRGAFAGTLSPQPMDSRTDGALSRASLRNDNQLAAEYLRYAAKDPLCCASRTTSVEFDIGKDAVLRPLSANTSPNR